MKTLNKFIQPICIIKDGLLAETTVSMWKNYFDARNLPYYLIVYHLSPVSENIIELKTESVREAINNEEEMISVTLHGIKIIFPPTVYKYLEDNLKTDLSCYQFKSYDFSSRIYLVKIFK